MTNAIINIMAIINAPFSEHQLPTHFQPSHYDLKIATDLKSLKFYGKVFITLKVVEDTSTITLNALDLDLDDAEVELQDQVLLPVLQSIDKLSERASFVFPLLFKAGSEVRLRLSFVAPLADHLEGYHKASWVKDGKSTSYAVTQLAVRVFLSDNVLFATNSPALF